MSEATATRPTTATPDSATAAAVGAGAPVAPKRPSIFRRGTSFVFNLVIGWAGFILLWYVVLWTGLIAEQYLSPPHVVAITLIQGVLPGGEILPHILPSLQRSLVGFALAVVGGVLLGIAIGWFKAFERVVDPVLQFFRQTSALALLPVFLLFFGLGETSKYAIVLYAAIWPILLTTIAAVKDVEKLQINAARSMGASETFIFLKVVLPAAVPRIFPGIRLGGAYAITVLVAAEMIGAPAGLGMFTLTMQQTFQIPQMYAGIVMLGLLGLAVNYALVLVERRLTGWQEGITNG